MKRLLFKKATVLSIVFFETFFAEAQQNKPKYEFGFNLGFLVYQGDLTPEKLGSFKTQKFSFGFHASRIFSPSFSVRGNLVLGKLYGDDAKYSNPEYRQQRNFKFSSPVTEITGQLVWSPLARNYAEKGFSPYVFAGAGFSFLKIRRDYSNISTTYFDPETSDVWAGLTADASHTLPRVIPVIPAGIGVKYFFTPKLAFNIETSYRLGYTDYLDGFSQAANPAKRDHYLNYSIGLILRTGKKDLLKCPKIRY